MLIYAERIEFSQISPSHILFSLLANCITVLTLEFRMAC